MFKFKKGNVIILPKDKSFCQRIRENSFLYKMLINSFDKILEIDSIYNPTEKDGKFFIENFTTVLTREKYYDHDDRTLMCIVDLHIKNNVLILKSLVEGSIEIYRISPRWPWLPTYAFSLENILKNYQII